MKIIYDKFMSMLEEKSKFSDIHQAKQKLYSHSSFIYNFFSYFSLISGLSISTLLFFFTKSTFFESLLMGSISSFAVGFLSIFLIFNAKDFFLNIFRKYIPFMKSEVKYYEQKKTIFSEQLIHDEKFQYEIISQAEKLLHQFKLINDSDETYYKEQLTYNFQKFKYHIANEKIQHAISSFESFYIILNLLKSKINKDYKFECFEKEHNEKEKQFEEKEISIGLIN